MATVVFPIMISIWWDFQSCVRERLGVK
jgi:hypothetical protein